MSFLYMLLVYALYGGGNERCRKAGTANGSIFDLLVRCKSSNTADSGRSDRKINSDDLLGISYNLDIKYGGVIYKL